MKMIKHKIKFLAVLFLIIGSRTIYAQYDALFSQYMFNEVSINPAYAGSKEAMSATLLHRQQWVNFPGRPITTNFSLHGPLLQNKMGLGLNILNDKVGVLNRNLVYVSYAYRIKVSEKGRLAFGLMTGLDNQINKNGTVKTTDVLGGTSDPVFVQNSPNLNALNFGTGIYFNTKKFYTGLSIPRLLDNYARFNYAGQSYKVTKIKASEFTYYYTVGGIFKLNEDLTLRTSGMLKAVKNAPAQIDLACNFLISNAFWVGAAYRSNSAVSALLGVQANKQLLFSYSFDYGLNSIQKYSQGSHEVIVSYLFSYKGKKVITPRYF